LSHQAGCVDFSTGSNDFGFTDSLLLSSRGKGGRNFGTEDDILDEDTFNRDTPLVSDIADNFSDFIGNGFSFSYDALNSASTNYVTKGGLSSLDESLAKVSDTKGSAIWIGDLEVDNRVAINRL
jgi:hypothetical protein